MALVDLQMKGPAALMAGPVCGPSTGVSVLTPTSLLKTAMVATTRRRLLGAGLANPFRADNRLIDHMPRPTVTHVWAQ